MQEGLDIIGAGFNFPLTLRRGSLALTRTHDEEIVQAILIILSTPLGARLMRPEFGCRIHELIFAPMNISTFMAAERYVEEALAYWEPRIEVIEVRVLQPGEVEVEVEGAMPIAITYRLRATHDERSLVFPFYTIPDEG